MDTVIIAFERESLSRKFCDLLESSGTANCLICTSGGQVRRVLNSQQVYCVICGCRLSDGPAEWLCSDLPAFCSLLMVGPQHLLDLCSNPDVFKLSTPVRKEEAIATITLLNQFGHRMERFVRPRRSDAEQELVDRAKRILMERYGMSEDEAHRTMQKRSMNSGCRLVQTARKILSEYDT